MSEPVVLDPTMGWWRRRYFVQPHDGPGNRAFTAKRAARVREYGPIALAVLDARRRWQDARDRETANRHLSPWP